MSGFPLAHDFVAFRQTPLLVPEENHDNKAALNDTYTLKVLVIVTKW